MLDNLIYCLNATVPIFLMMLLGMLFRRMGFFDQAFADKLNSYVFKIGLPVMLFKDLVESDFFSVWDAPFVLYCFLATLLSILLTAAVSLFWKDRSLRGEFVQVGYRSSIALLGAAFLENLYGNAGAASLVIIGAVPLYNVAAVLVLSLSSPQQSGVNRAALKKACKGIVTNPIILGIVVGLVWTLLRIPEPLIMEKTVNSISATATPLGLMALGASFDLKKALGRWKPAVAATAVKLVVLAAVFLPAAVAMGARDDKLVAALACWPAPPPSAALSWPAAWATRALSPPAPSCSPPCSASLPSPSGSTSCAPWGSSDRIQETARPQKRPCGFLSYFSGAPGSYLAQKASTSSKSRRRSPRVSWLQSHQRMCSRAAMSSGG